MYHDESGVSAIIGTLMLTPITIPAASGLALLGSGADFGARFTCEIQGSVRSAMLFGLAEGGAAA